MSGAEGEASLTIGDLAARSGVSTSTLRMWESRHGFPEPHRLDSGHRRFTEVDVANVREVARRRDQGVRLDASIASVLGDVEIAGIAEAGQAAAGEAPRPPSASVFADLRRRHPALSAHRLKKSTLLAMSWAIEDEFVARAQGAHVFGAFQRAQHFESARGRWTDIGRLAESSFVFADFEHLTGEWPEQVPLTQDAPMIREWAVVCDSPDLPVALTAWEIPGQQKVPDLDRRFESIWTVDAVAVRDAARVCASVARDAGASRAATTVDLLARPSVGPADPTAVAELFSRIVAYIDTSSTRRP